MKNAVHATHSRASDMAAGLLSQLSEALACGNSEALTEYLKVMAKFHRYSYYNSMLIYTQRPNATHVAGYARWKQLGRFVKPGEKGIVILAPSIASPKIKPDPEPESGEARPVRFFMAVHVWDVTQTEGQELPAISAVTGEVGSHLDRLRELAGQHRIRLGYAADLTGARGISHGGAVTLLFGMTPAEELQVLAHELAHEFLHRGARRIETTRQIRELEAEAVAFVVTSACGLENPSASWDYIRLYQGNEKLLAQSFSYIQLVAAEILDYVL